MEIDGQGTPGSNCNGAVIVKRGKAGLALSLKGNSLYLLESAKQAANFHRNTLFFDKDRNTLLVKGLAC